MLQLRYAVGLSTRDTLPASSGVLSVDAADLPAWLLAVSTGRFAGQALGSESTAVSAIFDKWLSPLSEFSEKRELSPHHAALAAYVAKPTSAGLADVTQLCAGALPPSSKSPFFKLSAETLILGTFEDSGSGGIIRSIVITSTSEQDLPSLVPPLRESENSFPSGNSSY